MMNELKVEIFSSANDYRLWIVDNPQTAFLDLTVMTTQIILTHKV